VNKQIGVEESKYLVTDDPPFTGRVGVRYATAREYIYRGSTAGRCGRVVATRRPVSGGAWCVPESLRTSGLTADSGDLNDRRSTADTCLVLLRGVGSPGARVSSGDLCIRSSAGSEGRLSVVGLSPVPFS